MRANAPGRVKLGPIGEQGQGPGGRSLVDKEAEQFQRGGIDPVQVFEDVQHRLLRRLLEQPPQ
jgi:hypothetical protein